MFLLGSAAIGLVAARFMKASSEQGSYNEGIGLGAQSDTGQDWGETSQSVDTDDVESLARPRETPDPYGSPAYGA